MRSGPCFAPRTRIREDICASLRGWISKCRSCRITARLLVLATASSKLSLRGWRAECGDLLTSVRAQFPSSKPVISDEPVVLHFDDALQLLRDNGCAPEGGDDLSGADELRLGELVKEKARRRFLRSRPLPVVDPTLLHDARPFRQYEVELLDFFLRGQEDRSGAQRVHDPSLLRDQLRARAGPCHFPTPSRADSPLGLAKRPRRCADLSPPSSTARRARGLRLWPGARRLPLPRARQHHPPASLFPRDPKRCAP